MGHCENGDEADVFGNVWRTKAVTVFEKELESLSQRSNYVTNKNYVNRTDDGCTMDTLDLKDYGRKHNKDNKWTLVVLDYFSRCE